MVARVKYQFDDDFGAGPKNAEKPLSQAELAIKLGEAESKGFRDGFAAAEKEGTAVAARRQAVAFEHIGDALDKLARGFSGMAIRLEDEAVELAVAISRKLAPELVARQPLAEITALAGDCLKQLSSAPHVVVRVNDALQEIATTELTAIARARGFEGRLMVLADPDIAVGDCQIEWADGGVVRNAARTDAVIDSAIGRYLGAREAAATTEEQQHEDEVTDAPKGGAT